MGPISVEDCLLASLCLCSGLAVNPLIDALSPLPTRSHPLLILYRCVPESALGQKLCSK